MNNINNLISLLGEDNEKRIKDKITDIIIESVEDDLNNANREWWVLDPDDITNFVDECKKEAFDRIKEDVIQNMMKKINSGI